jgi:hypothetical protein
MARKATASPPHPSDISLVQLTVPYSTSSHRGQQDWHVLGRPQRAVDIKHRVLHATQYEFYLPAAIWNLPMTRQFIKRISNLAAGATIFKGATGVWREEKQKGEKGEAVEEDVYIYRIIVNAEVLPADNARNGIHSEIADLSAALSICDFISQKELIFTEAMIILDRGILTIPAGGAGGVKVLTGAKAKAKA